MQASQISVSHLTSDLHIVTVRSLYSVHQTQISLGDIARKTVSLTGKHLKSLLATSRMSSNQ